MSMRQTLLPFTLLVGMLACARGLPRAERGPSPAAMTGVLEAHRVAGLTTRRFTHGELWTALEPALRSPALTVEEIGRSVQGRAIRAVSFGEGPVRVLLWSQMHGDESTATMALADIIAFFARSEGDPLHDRLRRALTVTMVPMLNPDGAELFQRRNAMGVDINRDARKLATPEARALKSLRDRLTPAFGFNLHDQGARTLAGERGAQVAIALLAPAARPDGGYDETRTRARLVAAAIAQMLAPELDGRIAKYDDTFNPRAFGDLMQQWGTSTVLIESGALPGDPEKQRLRDINGRAILASLDAIATGRYRDADPAAYERLPMNAGIDNDLLVLGARVVLGEDPPMPLDIALIYDDAVARTGPRVREIGDLDDAAALDTLDASGLFLHPEPSMVAETDGRAWLRVGVPAAFTLRRGADRGSEVVRRVP
jgi:hypothetical protein